VLLKAKPDKAELLMMFVADGFTVRLIHGMTLNPITLNWSWIANTSVGYALHAVKAADRSSDS